MALLFAAVHFIVVGGGILMGAQNGDGALGLVFWDLPLLELCAHSPLGRYVCSFTPRGWVIYVLAGTLIYAVIGFIIGAAIDGLRALIARRWRRG